MMNQKNEMEYIPSSRQKMVPKGKDQEETEHTKSNAKENQETLICRHLFFCI